jgi:hypothetical protein
MELTAMDYVKGLGSMILLVLALMFCTWMLWTVPPDNPPATRLVPVEAPSAYP